MERNQCSEISAKRQVYILTGFVVTMPKLYKTFHRIYETKRNHIERNNCCGH